LLELFSIVATSLVQLEDLLGEGQKLRQLLLVADRLGDFWAHDSLDT
jgi:hypothetical protein